jgi:hypothetical protein
MNAANSKVSRAQISRAAISRLYIAMRHLFIRGSYKPLGISGEAMIQALLELKPEIYGLIADPEKVELDGLLYIFQRLPQGIEECSFVKLISREGFEKSPNPPIIPAKRRRNCYRIDDAQMFVEMTRGRSDIYDVLTHLTFMYIESEKIRRNALDHKGRFRREWTKLLKIVDLIKQGEKFNPEVGFSYLSTLLGRTYEETALAYEKFGSAEKVNNLFSIIYWLGQNSIREFLDEEDREISFSSTLREKIGQHIFGTSWAINIKNILDEKSLIHRPIHIISSNLHSVLNCIYAKPALKTKWKALELKEVAEKLSLDANEPYRENVRKYALLNGMFELNDLSGVNIPCQIIDCSLIKDFNFLQSSNSKKYQKDDVIIVMDYAFGEQAYELMDELLKPYGKNDKKTLLNVRSISIMGKAGILCGTKGDVMIPNAHVFEGSADNYPFENKFDTSSLNDSGLNVFKGPMITVLGTSLQNKDILRYFLKSSWKAIGLEMEGAHYQKAIQAASKIRNSIKKDVHLRYAYYASDNPLETGSTLASGGLGIGGVKSTYLITLSILKSIFNQKS